VGLLGRQAFGQGGEEEESQAGDNARRTGGLDCLQPSPFAHLQKTTDADVPFAQTGKTSSGVAFPFAHLLLVVGSRGGREEEEPGKEAEEGGRAPAGELCP
jgi:hypothetical protein